MVGNSLGEISFPTAIHDMGAACIGAIANIVKDNLHVKNSEAGEVKIEEEVKVGGEGEECDEKSLLGALSGGRLEQLPAEQTLKWRLPQLQSSTSIVGGFKPG